MSRQTSRHARPAAVALLLALAAAYGCRDAQPPAPPVAANSLVPLGVHPGTVHPTEENLPRRSELAASISISGDSRGGGAAERFARRLARARQVGAFGAVEGTPDQVFGNIEDIAAGEDGRLYVLDSRYNNVRIFDASGRPLASFGGPGGGPAEFRAPEALSRDRQGRILVADRHNRIKLFAPQGASYAVQGSISVRFVPEDFCLLGDAVFVQGIERDAFLHAFSASGQRLRSFGAPYATANWLVREQLSDGPVACSEEAGTVVTMLKYLPVVYGYSPQGELRWVSRLEDFRPIRITEEVNAKGKPRVSFEGDAPYDIAESLQTAPGGLVVVQTARRTPQSNRDKLEFAELRTYVLSAATGQGVYVGNHLPRIGAVTGTRVLAGENDPYPRVRILEMPGAEAGR
ncbi:MAG TPA: 6-bladed beta-propeller [Longimicrobium sp.]|nr:6-bladed beta-propeller [Longimicrobium sp.]